jgi:hypothetical protein
MPTPMSKKWLIAVFLIIYCVAGVTVVRKALDDRSAFLRWSENSETLKAGDSVYGEAGGLYPNLPMMLLILMPFHALGPVAGAMAWMTVKFLIILFIFQSVVRVAENKGPPFPAWALLVILLLSGRVFISDLTHGNVNLLIGGLVVAALVGNFYKQDFLAGFSIGLAAILKVTPALFIPYYFYKRNWMSLAGSAAGLLVFGWIVPGMVLGVSFNNQLIMEWYQQMVHPFIAGLPVDFLQTQHMNQSLTGLLYRFFTDCMAVEPDLKRGYAEVRVNFVSLNPHTVSVMIKLASLAVLGLLAWFCRTPRDHNRHPGHLGEFALVFLSMLFLSERSWKHHFVLLILAHGFLIYYLLFMNAGTAFKRTILILLGAAVAMHSFSGNLFFGHHGSDILEAWGIHFWGAFALFISCGLALTDLRRRKWPKRPRAPDSEVL